MTVTKLTFISGISAAALGAVLLVIRILLFFSAADRATEAHTIGIIGGADGPTAIFLTSKIGLPRLLGISGICGLLSLAAGIALIIIGTILYIKSKKPEN